MVTTTPTGSVRLRALFEDRVRHVSPYDLRYAVGRFLDAVAPRLVLVMETEVWPNDFAREVTGGSSSAARVLTSAKGDVRHGHCDHPVRGG